jgi:3D (Asp-Asp-Asp) domain-containing protein
MKGLLALTALLAAALPTLAITALLLSTSAQDGTCQLPGETPTATAPAGAWTATAYGPPWGDTQGDGITTTRLNLTTGPPAYEIAVDPNLIPLGSYVHITPNPFNTTSAFYAGDTGSAITGKHIDIYDWYGRASQNAWGTRTVTITPATTPGGNNLLDGAAPTPTASEQARCQATGALRLTAGQTALIQPDGTASAPRDAPTPVKLAIAAGNLIHTLPYPEPDQHYGTLAQLWPAYDCSGATSLVLYAAGLLGPTALDSTELENYGQPGPGHWITIYANSAHAWIVIAGIALDTADYGGPPIPAGTGPRWRAEPLANLSDGTTYVARHPAGL